MIVIQHNIDVLDRTRRRLARGRRRRQAGHRPRPAPARPHRRARPRVAHRRALLQVIRSPPRSQRPHPCSSCSAPPSKPSARKTNNRQRFAVGPLEPGFGHTIGNSLRRTLLSSIPGAAITDGALRRRPPRVRHHHRRRRGRHRHHLEPQGHRRSRRLSDDDGRAAPRRAWPGRHHRRRHQVPERVEILNKDLHIATLNAKGRLAIDLTVEPGRGYLSSDRDIAEPHDRRRSRSTPSSRRSAG